MRILSLADAPEETWREGVRTRMLVSAATGAGGLCIFEQWVAPGTGAPTHSHAVEEVLTVVSGDAEVWLGAERSRLAEGQSVVVPAGAPHGFTNGGPNDADPSRVTQDEFLTVPGSLLRKAQTAQAVFDGKFLLPFAPERPDFFLVPGNNQVSVLWQPSPTESPP